jgi:hypothetical protein
MVNHSTIDEKDCLRVRKWIFLSVALLKALFFAFLTEFSNYLFNNPIGFPFNILITSSYNSSLATFTTNPALALSIIPSRSPSQQSPHDPLHNNPLTIPFTTIPSRSPFQQSYNFSFQQPYCFLF